MSHITPLSPIKVIHGTLKTIEVPPNLGINLPLSIKPTNSNNSINTNSPSNNNKKMEEMLIILKKHPCRQCDKSFSSSHSLCRHNCLKHKGLRKVYRCPHCPALSQPFTKRVLLDQHVQMMHGIKEPEGKTVRSENVEELPDKETTPSPKRKPGEDEGLPGLSSRGR
ncbi:unnamed protein product, partial [Pleuronectes platessa]